MNVETIKKYIVEMIDKIENRNVLIIILDFVQKCYFK